MVVCVEMCEHKQVAASVEQRLLSQTSPSTSEGPKTAHSRELLMLRHSNVSFTPKEYIIAKMVFSIEDWTKLLETRTIVSHPEAGIGFDMALTML